MAEYLAADKKQEIFAKYGKSNTDTGSAESQIALFSYRIAHLTEHLRNNKKDFGTQRALLRLVGKRRRLLSKRFGFVRETGLSRQTGQPLFLRWPRHSRIKADTIRRII